MSDITEVLDRIASTTLNEYLAALGFRQNGRTFIKLTGDAIQMLYVKEGQSSFGNSGKFTINLGIYFPQATEQLEILTMLLDLEESDCQVRERIGFLMPMKRDHWWMVINPVIDLEGLAVEVKEAVAKYGLPWFDKYMEGNSAKNIKDKTIPGTAPAWH